MAELRGKVMNGTVKPVTPGKYSMDLVMLMQSMLNLSPAKRPTLDKILASPAVQKRLGTASSTAGTDSKVIGTIKVGNLSIILNKKSSKLIIVCMYWACLLSVFKHLSHCISKCVFLLIAARLLKSTKLAAGNILICIDIWAFIMNKHCFERETIRAPVFDGNTKFFGLLCGISTCTRCQDLRRAHLMASV